MAEEKQNFETALKKLEALVAQMESGDLSLDEMLVNFEEGRKLVAFCTTELDSIRQRIEKVVTSAPPQVEPLNLLQP